MHPRLAPRRVCASDKPADDLDLTALMAGLAAVPERRAAFQETRRFAALDQPLLSTGHLLYRRPGYLSKTTDWPQPETLVVDGGPRIASTWRAIWLRCAGRSP